MITENVKFIIVINVLHKAVLGHHINKIYKIIIKLFTSKLVLQITI